MRKTIDIYDFLPDEERVNWLTIEQVVSLGKFYMREEQELVNIDKVPIIKSKLFAVQTSEYAYHLLHEEGEFYGVPYEIQKLYDRQSIIDYNESKRGVGDKIFRKEWARANADKRLKDFRSFVNDKRNLELPVKEHIVEFYGDERKAIRYSDKAHQFRSYYAMFLNHSLITDSFCAIHNLNRAALDMLTFVHTYKFFTPSDLHHSYSSQSMLALTENSKKNRLGGRRVAFTDMMSEGWIEPFRYDKMSMLKRGKKKFAKKLFKTTEKTDKLIEDYMDYLMYKRKIPYLGNNRSGTQRLTTKDIRVNYLHDRVQRSRKFRNHPYMFYEYCYDYINYKAEVELFDDDMVRFMKKSESAEFYFNPMVYKIAQDKYTKSSGEIYGAKHVKSFLGSFRWGIKS